MCNLYLTMTLKPMSYLAPARPAVLAGVARLTDETTAELATIRELLAASNSAGHGRMLSRVKMERLRGQ
jgi:hypothetical protein